MIHLNGPISSKEIEIMLRTFPQGKLRAQIDSSVSSTKNLGNNTNSTQLFQKVKEDGVHSNSL